MGRPKSMHTFNLFLLCIKYQFFGVLLLHKICFNCTNKQYYSWLRKQDSFFILSIFVMRVEFEVVCITAKPYIQQRILFHCFCSKSLPSWHGHNYFWPLRLWRLLKTKNTFQKANKAWRSVFLEECLKT